MPGTPKRNARMIGTLEFLAAETACGIWAECPKQYYEYIRGNAAPHPTELGRAWQCAAHHTMLAMISLEQLGQLLRAKANIQSPSICERYFTDDEFPFAVRIVKKTTPPDLTRS